MWARLAQRLEHRICNAMVIGLDNINPRTGSDLRNQSRSGKKSQYRIRLEEKQKLRFHYGLTERQLLKYVRIARKAKGSTGQVLLQLLEMRLDNILLDWIWLPLLPQPVN
ncbi:hypothetical protein EJD97_012912, partial [Solanum chilense]